MDVGGHDRRGTMLAQRLHAAARAEVQHGADGIRRRDVEQGPRRAADPEHVVGARHVIGHGRVPIREDQALDAVDVDRAHVDGRHVLAVDLAQHPARQAVGDQLLVEPGNQVHGVAHDERGDHRGQPGPVEGQLDRADHGFRFAPVEGGEAVVAKQGPQPPDPVTEATERISEPRRQGGQAGQFPVRGRGCDRVGAHVLGFSRGSMG